MALSVVMAGGGGEFEAITEPVRRAAQTFQIVHSLPSLRNAEGVVRRARPELFLMGLNVPDEPSLKLIRTLSEEVPTRVVVMCRKGNAGAAVEALGAGAAGYLLTGMDRHDVVRLLRAAVS